MPKQAISVTLRSPNLLWIKGQMKTRGLRSVSETLDTLIEEARGIKPSSVRSVVGTVTISASDPELGRAEGDIQALFDASLDRPLAMREARSKARAAQRRRHG